MSDWISVREVLPDERVLVLTFGNGGYSLNSYYPPTTLWLGHRAHRGITHWKALEPPENNEETAK